MAAMAEGITGNDLEKLANLIGAYMSKQQPEEQEEESYDEYDYRAVKEERDLAFHPDKFFYGINFRTMILNPDIFGRPWYMPIKHRYVEQLQYSLEQARLFIQMNELDKVDLLKKQCENLKNQVFQLERDLAKAQAQNVMREQYLTTTMEVMGGNKKLNLVAQDVGMEPIREDSSSEQERASTGQFVSTGSFSGETKRKMAAAYSEAGCRLEDIGHYLGVKASSVRTYVTEMKQHWRRREYEGREYIAFDADFGDEAYWLDEFSPDLLQERILEMSA